MTGLLRANGAALEQIALGPRPSTPEQAALSRTTHQYVKGIGFVDHGDAPPLPARLTHAGTECDSPAGVPDRSRHWVKPPGGGSVPLAMSWVAREKAWEYPGGVRVAFTALYLAHHGWRYLGPA